MKRFPQIQLVIIGIVDIIAAAIIAYHFSSSKEVVLTVIPGMAVFNFFMYKLLTGWLIINMNAKVEGTRQTDPADAEYDHLKMNVSLVKGSTDSVWIKKIEIRLSKTTSSGAVISPPFHTLEPFNAKKRGYYDGEYWDGKLNDFYTLSAGEEGVFGAYTRVPKNEVIVVELLVLGTRLFYGIESSKPRYIQWRSSTVILPVEEKKG